MDPKTGPEHSGNDGSIDSTAVGLKARRRIDTRRANEWRGLTGGGGGGCGWGWMVKTSCRRVLNEEWRDRWVRNHREGADEPQTGCLPKKNQRWMWGEGAWNDFTGTQSSSFKVHVVVDTTFVSSFRWKQTACLCASPSLGRSSVACFDAEADLAHYHVRQMCVMCGSLTSWSGLSGAFRLIVRSDTRWNRLIRTDSLAHHLQEEEEEESLD